MQTTTAPTAPEVNKSTRGNILKALRQPAEITNMEGKQVANFTINSITPDAPYPEPAKNSHITVLDVTVQTMPELADTSTSPSSFDINAAMFKFVGANGTTFNRSLSTMGAYTCLPDEQTSRCPLTTNFGR